MPKEPLHEALRRVRVSRARPCNWCGRKIERKDEAIKWPTQYNIDMLYMHLPCFAKCRGGENEWTYAEMLLLLESMELINEN